MSYRVSCEGVRIKLRDGVLPSIGTWMQIPSPEIGEILGSCGFDWIAVDLEHGHFSVGILTSVFRAIEINGTLPFARVFDGSERSVRVALDAGACGLIIPRVETVDQMKEIFQASHLPPHGRRGVGFARANLYGKHFARQVSTDASRPIIVPMIESKIGVSNLQSILALDMVDAVMVGPYDLSATVGVAGDFTNPKFVATLELVESVCKAHKVPVGYHVVEPDKALLTEKVRQGYRFLAYSMDTAFIHAGAKMSSWGAE